jgi:hypothetical protein
MPLVDIAFLFQKPYDVFTLSKATPTGYQGMAWQRPVGRRTEKQPEARPNQAIPFGGGC